MIDIVARKEQTWENKEFIRRLSYMKISEGLNIKNIKTLKDSIREKAKSLMRNFCRKEKKWNKDYQICLTTIHAELDGVVLNYKSHNEITCPEFFTFNFKNKEGKGISARDVCVYQYHRLNTFLQSPMRFKHLGFQEALMRNIHFGYKYALANFLSNLN